MTHTLRSADELVKRILSDPQTWEKVQADPAKELLKLAKDVGEDVPPAPPPPPLESDVFIYRMVVAIIGTVAIVAVIGAILAVALPEKPNSTALLTALVSISSAAIGALAGLLSPMGFRR